MGSWWTDGSGRYLERRATWVEASIQIGVGLVELAAGMAGDSSREAWAREAGESLDAVIGDVGAVPAPIASSMAQALASKQASSKAKSTGLATTPASIIAQMPPELGCGWLIEALVPGGRRKTWRNKQEGAEALFDAGARYNAMLVALADLPKQVAWASRQLSARGWALSSQEAWAAKLCARCAKPWLGRRVSERGSSAPLDEQARVKTQRAYAVYVEDGGYQGFLDIDALPVAGLGQARLHARLDTAKRAALASKSAAVVRVRVEMEAMELCVGEFDGKELRGELARIESKDLASALAETSGAQARERSPSRL